jgi:deoxycytidine triphosphate deaminase
LVLSRPDILRYIETGKLRFTPKVSDHDIAQVSVDLRLGHKFITFKQGSGYISSIQVDPSLWDSADLWNHVEQDTFVLVRRLCQEQATSSHRITSRPPRRPDGNEGEAA